MALHRCAACGSPKVITDTQSGGVSYNYRKGIVGTVVLGAGGAAAGIESKTEQVFKCPDCGITLSYPMDVEVKNAIDAGVRSASARDHLTVYGVAAPWAYFTNKYSNIESGPADEEIKANEAHAAARKEINTQTMRIIADRIIEEYQSLQLELALLDNPENNPEELQAAWEMASKGVLDARQQAYAQAEAAVQEAHKQAVTKAESDIQGELAELSSKRDGLAAEAASLQAELPTLGIFKGKRKKEINEQLQKIRTETNSFDTKINELTTALHNVGGNLLKMMSKELDARKAEIDKKFPLEESPVEHRQKLLKKKAYLDRIKVAQSLDKKKAANQIVVYKFIEIMASDSQTRIAFTTTGESERNGYFKTYPCSDVVEVQSMLREKLSEIVDLDIPNLSFFPEQAVDATLRDLSLEGTLCIERNKGKKYYYISK